MTEPFVIRIVALTGPLAGQDWEFEKDVITIGRSETNDVPLVDDTTVSRSHATLRKIDGKWELRDDNSANGTHILDSRGRRRLDGPEVFNSNRRFFFGSSQIECQVGEVAPGGLDQPAEPSARTQPVLHRSMHLSISLQAGDLVFRVTRFDASVSEFRTPYAAQAIQKAIDHAAIGIAQPLGEDPADSASDRHRAIEELGEQIGSLAFPVKIRDEMIASSDPYLILAIDHDLIHIPWELARFDGPPLVLKYSVGRQVVFRDPSGIRQPPTHIPMAPGYILLVANALDEEPRVQRHAEELMNLLRSKLPDTTVELLAGERATKREVLTRMQESDVLYFVGPEVPESDESYHTGWRVADGHIGEYEIRPLQRAPALVISNVVGHAEASSDSDLPPVISGTSEIAARFIAAGTRNCVTSYWPAGEDSAAAFANSLFEGLLGGHAIGGVVKDARQDTIAKFGDVDPSPFAYVLYGDPTIAPIIA